MKARAFITIVILISMVLIHPTDHLKPGAQGAIHPIVFYADSPSPPSPSMGAALNQTPLWFDMNSSNGGVSGPMKYHVLVERPEPGPNDWVVEGTEIRKGEVITLTGNLIVKPGGNLTLINCLVYVNCSYPGEWQVFVDNGGVLKTVDTTITAVREHKGFILHVRGRAYLYRSKIIACEMYFSTEEGVDIKECVYTVSPDIYGVFFNKSGHVFLRSCKFSGNDTIDLPCFFQGCSDVHISNCYFKWAELRFVSSRDAYVINCNLTYSYIELEESRDMRIANCVLTGSITCRKCVRMAIVDCSSDDPYSPIILTGYELRHYASHTITNVSIGGRPVCYVVNSSGLTIGGEVGEVIVANSHDIEVHDIENCALLIGAFSWNLTIKAVSGSRASIRSCYNVVLKDCGITSLECQRSTNLTFEDGGSQYLRVWRSSNLMLEEVRVFDADFSYSSDITLLECRMSSLSFFRSSRFTIRYCRIDNLYIYYSIRGVIKDNIINYIKLDGKKLRHFIHLIENCTTTEGASIIYVANSTFSLTEHRDIAEIIVVNSPMVNITVRSPMTFSYFIVAFSSNIVIKGCVFKGFYGYSLRNASITECVFGPYVFFLINASYVSLERCLMRGWRFWWEHGWSYYAMGLSLSGSHDIVLRNCMFVKHEYGLYCRNSHRVFVVNCGFLYNGVAMGFYESSVVVVENSTIAYSTSDGISCYCSNLTIFNSNIYSNWEHGLYVIGTSWINASYNWWGSAEGPEYKYEGDREDPEEIWGDPDEILPGYLIYQPWLTEPADIDAIAPNIRIDLEEGAVLKGLAVVEVKVYDDVGIREVIFYIDGLRVFVDREPPYEYEWNTLDWEEGPHDLMVVAYDLSNNYNLSYTTIMIDNTPPVIEFLTYTPEQPSHGKPVTVVAGVVDAVSGVDHVILMYRVGEGGWRSLRMRSAGGHVWTGGIPGQKPGTVVEFKVIAYDRAGHKAVSPIRSYTVAKLMTKRGMCVLGGAAALLIIIALIKARRPRKPSPRGQATTTLVAFPRI